MDIPKLILRLLEWLQNRKRPSGGQKINPTAAGNGNTINITIIDINSGKD